jgi:hypothetical protein
MALSAAGVATGVVAAVAPSATAAETNEESTGATSGSLVAYVHDAARGEVSVMRGEHEVVVHDPALVRLISKHA